MRLLRCSFADDSFPALVEFYAVIPPYAILSHRWGNPSDEVLFKDLEIGADISLKGGYQKLKWCCEQALKDGLEYVWIDTCCINKSSSAELSEAINSMFSWYSKSTVCYVYLEDVPTAEILESHSRRGSPFRRSKWWTRGWTLQELLAPDSVEFYDQKWCLIETKHRWAELVSEITAIHPAVLRGDFDSLPHSISVAQKMSWAAGRETTRVEDRAYSMLGLFGVHMPPLYGEGSRAFIRLQEEIMKTNFDHSLFAWTKGTECSGLLAMSADQFTGCGDVIPVEYNKYAVHFRNSKPVPEFSQTNYGTRIQLPLLPDGSAKLCRAFLACTRTSKEISTSRKEFVYLDLWKRPGAGIDTYERVASSICAVDLRSSDIEIVDVFVSNTSLNAFGFRCPAVTLIKKVNFSADMTMFPLRGTGGKRERTRQVTPIWTYYSGAVIRDISSRFNVDFLDHNDDAFLAMYIGRKNFHSEFTADFNFFLMCGFHNGKLWTDIWIVRGNLASDTAVIFAYDSYQPGTRRGEEARSAARSSTERGMQGIFTSEDIRKWGVDSHDENLKVGIRVTPGPAERDGYASYEAVIIFEF